MFLFKSRFTGLSAALPTRDTIERGRAAVKEGAHAAAAAVERLEPAALAAGAMAAGVLAKPRGRDNHRVALTVAAVGVTAVAATAAYVWWKRRNEAAVEREAATQPPMRTEPVAAWSPPTPPAPVAAWPAAPWPVPAEVAEVETAAEAEPALSEVISEPIEAPTAEVVSAVAPSVTASAPAIEAPVTAAPATEAASAFMAAPLAPMAPVTAEPVVASAPSMAEAAVAAPALEMPAPVAIAPAPDVVPAWLAPSSVRATYATPIAAVETPEALVAIAVATAEPVSSLREALLAPEPAMPVVTAIEELVVTDEPAVAQVDAEPQQTQDAEPEAIAAEVQPLTPAQPAWRFPSAAPADEDSQYSARPAQRPGPMSSSPFGRQFSAPQVRTVLPSRRVGLP